MYYLRPYKSGDESYVLQLVKDVLEEYGLETNPQTTDKNIQNIGESYSRNGGVFKVLEQDGRIIGSYGLYRVSAFVCELRKMYIHRQFRGKGFGKMMMEDVIYEAKTFGFAEMVLETNSCLKEVLVLYKQYGFEAIRFRGIYA